MMQRQLSMAWERWQEPCLLLFACPCPPGAVREQFYPLHSAWQEWYADILEQMVAAAQEPETPPRTPEPEPEFPVINTDDISNPLGIAKDRVKRCSAISLARTE